MTNRQGQWRRGTDSATKGREMMMRSGEILAMTVRELVAQEPTAAQVLGLYRSDLCRCSGLALRSAALIAGANPDEVARGVADGVARVCAPAVAREGRGTKEEETRWTSA